MNSFRFLHAADIHLDSPLRGLEGHDGTAVERVRTATRNALERLVDIAIEERVDFLIVAGDLYDGDWRDFNTGLFFVKQMGRLNKENISVFLLYGNHDAQSQITKRLELPKNVQVFGTNNPDTFNLSDLGVVIHGHSYRQRDVTDNLVLDYPIPVPNTFNIGVLHTGLGGMGDHAKYAPCSIDDLKNKGYDYWALGHVHQRVVLHKHPYVVFPGNLQGRHIRETGAKGAYIVTVEDGEISALDFVSCDVVRWKELSVSLAGADSLSNVNDLIRDALESEVTDSVVLACRIKLEGRTTIHERLVASEGQVLADARASALGLGGDLVWIEKVLVATETAGVENPPGPLGELVEMLDEAVHDEDFLARVEIDFERFAGQLPYEVRTESDDEVLEAVVNRDCAALIDSVKPHLLAHLIAEEN